jgi:hypothetical protein
MIWWITGTHDRFDDGVPEVTRRGGVDSQPPAGGWDNQLPNYYVRPQDRV